MGLMKFLMVGVNVIFWAFGGTLLGVGIWLAVDPNAFDGMQASGMNDAMWAAVVYTMIAVGALVFLLGFLGCCGAWKNKKIMLKLYNVLVSVIILAEIVIIILAAIFWGSINDNLRIQMQSDVQNLYLGPTENTDGVTQSWNKMQYKWACCGSYDFTDYKASKYITDLNNPNVLVPFTCCVYKPNANYESIGDVVNEPACQNEARGYNTTRNFQYLNARGCYGQLSNFFSQNAAIIIGVTCGVLGLQIVAMIFACCLMKEK